ncbi:MULTISPECIES: CPBP family glutamic-type intramembrane protease [Cyanophyceae]|uniref:CPBP family glutamic-type intramembrane protease n=1 Tax=Leptolyngbya subtilissima DQ-A4 TaxID=2933933 RepID=A0ABV0K3C5_9CYAN|nr:CPBP family glutamic-type intramembrane protease [Nodosilinea sp. FACHB-141]MBD2112958.1 CPBP family intramembrane metalloprotease [Nodosilinea sp. FACHB-141]
MLRPSDLDLPLPFRAQRLVQRVAVIVAVVCFLGLLATKTEGAPPPHEPLATNFLSQAPDTEVVPNGVVTNYDRALTLPANRVETFPPTPLPTAPSLRPNGLWNGRLILPSQAEYAAVPGDWVWMDLWYSSPDFPELVGQRVKLTWKPNAQSQAYMKAVTRDVVFNAQAERSLANGNILPTRLNGRKAVGPLQSLAGARPNDDVTVRLAEVEVVVEGDRPMLRVGLEPIQITGREYGLVKLLGPDETVKAPRPTLCPGEPPCPTEYFRVQFYNAASGNFSGPTGTVRIPQQPAMTGDRFMSNLRDLAESPAGSAGWYIYGSRAEDGLFTVQALKPRALVQLQPDDVVLGLASGRRYLDRDNWQGTPQRQGTLQSLLVSATAGSADTAQAQWQEGDYGLVIHLFGGIGGEKAESAPVGTITGHFAYGLAQVVREPITNELQFDIQYQQIYAHNPNGIVSGAHDWADYMGDMQRGWLGSRPVSDVVVKLDAFIAPFQFGDMRISLFRELLLQLQVIAARYRVGDGTGVAPVTPATSCVQDSNQALFIAIQQIRRQIDSQPEIAAWVQQNPDSPEVERSRRFAALGNDLETMLVPYGVVRPDWQANAESLAGVDSTGDLTSSRRLLSGMLTWHSMMPRWAHDRVARIFLEHGGQLWFLRTNMVGGFDPTVQPVPPTTFFGGVPILGRVTQRLADAFATGLSWPMGLLGLVMLSLYGLVALPFGLRNRFLVRQQAASSPMGFALDALRRFIAPALLEETIFRVMLLPHPVEGVPGDRWLLWGIVSFVAFILYHVVLNRTLYRGARAGLSDPRFLVLAGWLGLVLIAAYWITGSLWLVVLMHWVVVLVWVYRFGGWARLSGVRAVCGRERKLTAPFR